MLFGILMYTMDGVGVKNSLNFWMNDSILCVKKAFEKLEEGKSFKVQKNF